jgi:hypothetical protein
MPGRDPHHDHEPAHQPAPAAATASPTRTAPSPAAAAALALQRGAGNRAAATRLDRAPAAAAPPARAAGAPAAAGPTTAPAAAAAPAEFKAACEQLYAALNIGGISGAEVERILRVLDANRAQGKALAAAYAAAYRGRSLDADLRKLSAADYVRARDYLWFGGLRTVTRILIALAGTGADTTSLMGLLAQAAKEGTMAQLEASWKRLLDDAHNPLVAEFKGKTLEQAVISEVHGVDVVRARALLRTAGTKSAGQLRPVDKIFIAMDQAGTDTALLFQGLAEAGPGIEQEFARYPYRGGLALLQTKVDLIDALDSELDGEDYTRALALLGYEQDATKGAFTSGRAGVKKSKRGRLVNVVRAAVQGVGTNTELMWQAIADASQTERDELKAILLDRSSAIRFQIVTDLDDAERARLNALLGIAEPASAPGAQPSSRGAAKPKLDDPVVVRLRQLGGVDGSTVLRAIKLSDATATAAFRTAYADTASPFRAYVVANTSASERADLATILSPDLIRRVRWCIGMVSDDEEYLLHLLGVHATDAQRRQISATPALMALLRDNLSTGDYRRALAALDPKDPTPAEAARSLERRIAEETGGIYDLVGSTAANVRDANRDVQVDTAAAQRAGTTNDPAVRAQLAGKAASANEALSDYAGARDSFIAGTEMVVNLAVGTLVTALTAGAAGPAVAAQLSRVALTMAAARVVTQKALRGSAFDLGSADAVRAAIDGAVEGLMNAHGALAARGVTVQMTAASTTAGRLTGSTYARLIRPAVEEALGGARDAAIGALVSAATDDRTWSEGLAVASERMAKTAVREAAVGAATAVAVGAGGKAKDAVKDRVRGRARPAAGAAHATGEPTSSHADAPHATGAEPAAPAPARTTADWLAMEQALGEAASRVPIVPNPKLTGTTVRVHYGDADGIRVEIGPEATAVHVARHAATASLLLRYEGPIGQLRRLYEQVRAILGGMPPYASAGFEARAEIDKLRAILRELEEAQGTVRARVDELALGDDAERARAALEAEMTHVQEQLAAHQANVDSYAAGRGFIAAEGLPQLPRSLSKAPPGFTTLRVPVDQAPKEIPPRTIVELDNGLRFWLDPRTGMVASDGLVGPTTERLGLEDQVPPTSARDTTQYPLPHDNAHLRGPNLGAEGPYGIDGWPAELNRSTHKRLENWIGRVAESLPEGWDVALLASAATRPQQNIGTARIYDIDLLVPDGNARVRKDGLRVVLESAHPEGAVGTHPVLNVTVEMRTNDPDVIDALNGGGTATKNTRRSGIGLSELRRLIQEGLAPGCTLNFETSSGVRPD